jgi:hypothetical protein
MPGISVHNQRNPQFGSKPETPKIIGTLWPRERPTMDRNVSDRSGFEPRNTIGQMDELKVKERSA